jgi:alpha-tubulin suppressor-like RCC1 family protein
VDGQVYVSGYNDYGQLGLPRDKSNQELIPKLLGGFQEAIESVKTGIFHSLLLTSKNILLLISI